MTIDFRIGQPVLRIYPEYREVSIEIEEIKAEDLEGIQNASNLSNFFGFSYLGFDKFLTVVDGRGFFEPFVEQHPGTVPLLPEDLTALDAIIARYKQAHPQAQAIFANEALEDMSSHYLAHLLRFRFWIAWALANCATPVFQNW